jgi:hypothetical protein
VHAFRLSHVLHTGQPLNGSSHTLEFGIWYSASSSLDLVGFLDTDFAGCGIDQKSTFDTCHFLGSSLVQTEFLVAYSLACLLTCTN